MNCKNVVSLPSEGSVADFDDSGYLVDISCCDRACFDRMEPDALSFAHDVLARVRPALTKGDFDTTQKAHGLVYAPDGLLADVELRALVPPSVYTRDPMHVMVAGGVMSVEVFLLMTALTTAAHACSWELLEEFCKAAWKFPHGAPAGKVHQILSSKLVRSLQKSKSLEKDCSFFVMIVA